MSRTADFDAAMAEVFGPPPELVAFGETVVLPREMPAVVMLEQERAKAGDVADEFDIRNLLALIVGEAQVTRWVEVNRIGVDGLWVMLRTIGDIYRPEDADPKPEAPTTARPVKATSKRPTKAAASRTSSKRGRSSKPTSGAST